MIMIRTAIIICISALLLLGPYGAGCAKEGIITLVPYIPPSYLSCTEVLPNDLLDAYNNPHLDFGQAEALYNDRVFIFKRIQVTENMLKWRAAGYVWAGNTIQCFPLTQNELDHLKVGDVVDIVGVSMGLHKQFMGLVFQGCVFLPSGLVQLPIEGTGDSEDITY